MNANLANLMVHMKTWCNEVIGAENTRNLPYLCLSCLLFLGRVAGETRKTSLLS